MSSLNLTCARHDCAASGRPYETLRIFPAAPVPLRRVVKRFGRSWDRGQRGNCDCSCSGGGSGDGVGVGHGVGRGGRGGRDSHRQTFRRLLDV